MSEVILGSKRCVAWYCLEKTEAGFGAPLSSAAVAGHHVPQCHTYSTVHALAIEVVRRLAASLTRPNGR